MIQKFYTTPCGNISYWTNDIIPGRKNLIFLPGLTADHRLFDKQIDFFEDRFNVLVWDAPGHAASRPFALNFTLMDKATWLHEILEKEQMTNPVLIGQSMGGYVSQAFIEKYPAEPGGFVCIDSAPLQKKYMTALEIWLLKHTEPIYKAYPWKALMRDGSVGCARSEYGRKLMKQMMANYDKAYYCRLAGHGFKMLADAVETGLPYEITCPTVLICGKNDHAGSAKGYNRRWARETGLPLYWIEDAGHNSNTDKPEEINRIIEEMLSF